MSAEPTVITAADGARATVQVMGAQVSSWVPAGGAEQLFVGSRAPVGAKAFKGGVPVCFPQFAAQGPLPQHGFARNLPWEPAGHGTEDAGGWAAFRLSNAGALASRWPHSFLLELRVSVGGPRLDIALSVINPGPRAWYFTGALHTYLRVDDIAHTGIEGLGGRPYLDKAAGGVETVQAEPLLRIAAATDRVYQGAREPLRLRDGERTVAIATTGFPDVVVWNPWREAEERLSDFAPGDYRHMVCVEAAVAAAPVSLERDERWSGSQTLTVQGNA